MVLEYLTWHLGFISWSGKRIHATSCCDDIFWCFCGHLYGRWFHLWHLKHQTGSFCTFLQRLSLAYGDVISQSVPCFDFHTGNCEDCVSTGVAWCVSGWLRRANAYVQWILVTYIWLAVSTPHFPGLNVLEVIEWLAGGSLSFTFRERGPWRSTIQMCWFCKQDSSMTKEQGKARRAVMVGQRPSRDLRWLRLPCEPNIAWSWN